MSKKRSTSRNSRKSSSASNSKLSILSPNLSNNNHSNNNHNNNNNNNNNINDNNDNSSSNNNTIKSPFTDILPPPSSRRSTIHSSRASLGSASSLSMGGALVSPISPEFKRSNLSLDNVSLININNNNLHSDHELSDAELSPEIEAPEEEEEEEEENYSYEDFPEFNLGGTTDQTGIVSSKSRNDSKAKIIKYGKGNRSGSALDLNRSTTHGSSGYKSNISVNAVPSLESSAGIGEVITSPTGGKNSLTNDTGNKELEENITQKLDGDTTLKLSSSEKYHKDDADDDDDDDDDSSNDGDWKQMATELEYDMYNEKGELMNRQHNPFDDILQNQHHDSASLGYTRIAAEEQATKFKNIDKGFEFLLNKENSNLKKLHKQDQISANNSKTDLSLNVDKEEKKKSADVYNEKVYFQMNDNHTHTDDMESSDEDETISATNQLATTKSMLADYQKIAYVGLVKLVIVEMATDLALIEGSSSVKMQKKLSAAHGNFQNWSIKMMERLYEHMELSLEERKMIENLSSHGVKAEDLSSSLAETANVSNPIYQTEDNEKYISKVVPDASGNTAPEEIRDKKTLDIDIKWTIVCDLFLILLFDAVYDSRSRNLLLRFGEKLGITHLEVFQFERRITDALEIEEASEQTWNEKEILETRKKLFKKKKLLYVGLATLGGGLVIGLSVGLLAPVIGAGIAAGLSTIGITGTSGFLAGVGGTAIVTTTGVVTGARIGSKGMMKRVGSVKTFEFRPLHNNRRVNLILTVSGWMNGSEDDVRLPFSTVDPVMGDLYSVLWEPDMLKSTGQTINILATEVLTQSIQQVLGSTILIAFMSSIQWPMALSKLGYILDNPWNVSLDRAWAAGLVLADTLIQRNLGVRPVTLVGFSLGARLIYSCLLELSKRGAYGLVENVILFGSPFVQKSDQLALARTVVSGQFVNGYSKKDWILGYLFRATSGGLRTVAGLSPITSVKGIENFDCTEYVSGHMEYRRAMPKLLSKLNWEVLNEEFVEIDEPDTTETERQRKLIHEFEEARDAMLSESNKAKNKKGIFGWFGPKKKEWWEVYEEGRKEIEQSKQKQILNDEINKAEGKAKEGDESEEGTEDPFSDEAIFDVDAIVKEIVELKENGELSAENLRPRSQSAIARESGALPPIHKLQLDEEEEEMADEDQDSTSDDSTNQKSMPKKESFMSSIFKSTSVTSTAKPAQCDITDDARQPSVSKRNSVGGQNSFVPKPFKSPQLHNNNKVVPNHNKSTSISTPPLSNEEFTPRPFKSPSVHKPDASPSSNSERSMRKSSVLQSVVLFEGAEENSAAEPSSPKKVSTEKSSPNQEVPATVEKEESPQKQISAYYDDDDEFATNGENIKMSFS